MALMNQYIQSYINDKVFATATYYGMVQQTTFGLVKTFDDYVYNHYIFEVKSPPLLLPCNITVQEEIDDSTEYKTLLVFSAQNGKHEQVKWQVDSDDLTQIDVPLNIFQIPIQTDFRDIGFLLF